MSTMIRTLLYQENKPRHKSGGVYSGGAYRNKTTNR